MTLAWLDIETPGLDPNTLGFGVLELAIVLTDDRAEKEIATFAQCCRFCLEDCESEIDDFVLDMHAANGLWDACETVCTTQADVEAAAIAFLRHHQVSRPPMCGSSIHFDRAWLKVHMPALEAGFHHRNIDASSLWQWAQIRGAEFNGKSSDHRALGDCRQSIELAHAAWNGGVKPMGVAIERLRQALKVEPDGFDRVLDALS